MRIAVWDKVFLVLAVIPVSVSAQLSSISDDEMSKVSGQGGVYLSGEIAINEDGGPLKNAYWGDCTDGKRCGARLSYKTRENGGWFVLDNIKGTFSFQGLTLKVRSIDSGFGGDGALFNRDVLEIGLPDFIKFEDVSFTYATSNRGRPTDASGAIYSDFKQTDIYGVEINGEVNMQGNVLVFPTGNP